MQIVTENGFGFNDNKTADLDLNKPDAMRLLRDMAFNLRRIVLCLGGGQWKGTRTLTIEPHSSVLVKFVEVKAAVMVHVVNITNDKILLLYNDQTYAHDEKVLKMNSFPLHPGKISKVLLEYKEVLYAYNPYDEPAQIKVDLYAERTCALDL